MSRHDQLDIESTAGAVRLVAEAVAASDFRRASDISDAALAQGFIHVSFYNARALYLERQGRDEDALIEFQRARALASRSWAILNAIGLCLTRLHRPDAAIETFDEAIRINPAYAPSYQRRGVVLGMAGRSRQAEDSFRRAVSLDPRNAEALASLASSAARRREWTVAEQNAGRAIVLDGRNATAHAALALVEIERGEFAAAERRLRPLVEDHQLVANARAVVLGILGDALDGEDRCAEAFGAYAAANAELRTIHAPRFAGRAAISSTLDSLIDCLGRTSAEAWQHSGIAASEQPARLHVFLCGFYRSGTTLLEQILASHPEVATIEERDLLAEPAEQYLTSAEGMDRLLELDGPDLESLRSDYWRRLRELAVPCDGKVFVDKHPLNTAKLPLIRKLFPSAKILFALRDPRDVVLSCFRRHFEINSAMFELLVLEDAARLYDRSMTFAELCRKKLSLQIFDCRYEDLISDFLPRIEAVCEFLAIAYDEKMRNFAEDARARDIRSPSAEQVRRGLFTGEIGNWRRYAAQLAPVMPILDRWAEQFGYSGGETSRTPPSSA